MYRGLGKRRTLAAAVSRVLLSPGLDPRHGFRSAVIVEVLGEPFRLAGPLARCLARRGPAITLMPRVTPVRHKRLTAIHAGVLLLSVHLASPPASSQDGLLHDLEIKPKKTQTAKKNQLYIKRSKNIHPKNIQLRAG
ncbi:hypothetical protein [Candidatus Accumulibacter sp. ACC007]|uniref:hypothetical protein n=1 Tax=Candidatus Accumulibacter sp. ACC007 TaxID=2823333 RepID=UPI0025B86666|nr:hypothetical protein [Candidatus Accumulibacter sp. ACC007]